MDITSSTNSHRLLYLHEGSAIANPSTNRAGKSRRSSGLLQKNSQSMLEGVWIRKVGRVLVLSKLVDMPGLTVNVQ